MGLAGDRRLYSGRRILCIHPAKDSAISYSVADRLGHPSAYPGRRYNYFPDPEEEVHRLGGGHCRYRDFARECPDRLGRREASYVLYIATRGAPRWQYHLLRLRQFMSTA